MQRVTSGDDTLADDVVIAATREWLERAVIGLNLCPFAKAVHSATACVIASATPATPTPCSPT